MTEQELRERIGAALAPKHINIVGVINHVTLAKETTYLIQLITQYGDQREEAGRIDENKHWLTVLAPSMDENVVYNSDFHERIAELKAKEVKGEQKF